jgi:ATP-dependent Clp protease ATP-binding subunit ClpB
VSNFLLDGIDTQNYGARPLRRKLEQLVENEIASAMIGGHARAPGKLRVLVENGQVKVAYSPA